MKRILLLTGFLPLLLASQTVFGASSASSSSAPSTLYERIKQETEQELVTNTVEPEVVAYVRAVMRTLNETVSDDDVTAAVKKDDTQLCGTRAIGTSGKTQMGCAELGNRIRSIVAQEQRVRALGRSLQLVATSYELPISHTPGQGVRLVQDIRGIVNIWGTEATGTGSAALSGSGARTRTKAVDAAVMRPLLETLGNALRNLNPEQRTAAVWRYQYGVRLVRNDRLPDFPKPFEDTVSGPGTERQYLFNRWAAVENALAAVWNAVKNNAASPPLQPNETILYVFPDTLLKETLPDNILVWVRTDGPGVPQRFGDSGLQWILPLEPVLPSLLNTGGDPIRGGTYPPPPMDGTLPADGRGLCSDPESARGYLCRAFTPASGEACPADPANPLDLAKINLVTCKDETQKHTTLAGPDVCRGIAYTESTFDPARNCYVETVCKDTCGPENALATASYKNNEGKIEVCMNNDMKGVNGSYALYHELVHAYQFCHMPARITPLYDDMSYDEAAAACCRIEGEAYRAQCDIIEQDGGFDGKSFAGIPINAETCAEVSTNEGCKNIKSNGRNLPGCFMSQTYPDGFWTAAFEAMKNNPKDLPTTCPDMIDPEKMDPRVAELIDAIEKRPTVCQPGQTDIYANRIGNNMCYIGQCVEETLEIYRTTGGQTPATVGDEIAPFHDTITGAPLGNAVINPPLTPPILPLYRPQLVVQQLESAICQLQGLPPLTPSILCIYNPSRNILSPVLDYIGQAQSFLQGSQSEADSTSRTLSLALGLGSRLGTTMYATELHLVSRSLADVLNTAVSLFKELGAIEFPTEMCPTDNTIVVPPAAS